jgi:hypothetical protein
MSGEMRTPPIVVIGLFASTTATTSNLVPVNRPVWSSMRRCPTSDERDAQRDRGERIAAVMNQVREQRNRPRQHKHDGLQRGSHREDAETPCDRLHPFARPDNGGNNHAVDMVVPVAMLTATRDRTERQTGVPGAARGNDAHGSTGHGDARACNSPCARLGRGAAAAVLRHSAQPRSKSAAMGARDKNFYNTIAKRYGYVDEATEIQDLYLPGRKDAVARRSRDSCWRPPTSSGRSRTSPSASPPTRRQASPICP